MVSKHNNCENVLMETRLHLRVIFSASTSRSLGLRVSQLNILYIIIYPNIYLHMYVYIPKNECNVVAVVVIVIVACRVQKAKALTLAALKN